MEAEARKRGRKPQGVSVSRSWKQAETEPPLERPQVTQPTRILTSSS